MPRGNQPQRKPVADTHDVRVAGAGGFNMDQLVAGGPNIEVVNGGAEFQKLVNDEKFMHEELTIRFHETGDPNAPKVIEIGVGLGGKDAESRGRDYRRGFMRGKVYKVPRFMVEVFAHAKVSALQQKPGPSGRPDDIVNELKHSFFYPFEVMHDPNPKGRAWLEKVLADPA